MFVIILMYKVFESYCIKCIGYEFIFGLYQIELNLCGVLYVFEWICFNKCDLVFVYQIFYFLDFVEFYDKVVVKYLVFICDIYFLYLLFEGIFQFL